MRDSRSTPPVLQISQLVKDYRGLRPLRIESLRLDEGDRVALSGVDRTAAEVLVNLITGATLPDRGEVIVRGRDTASVERADDWFGTLDALGVVSERAALLDGMTVAQNLALALTIAIDPVPGPVLERVGRLMDLVGIDGSLAGRPAGTLDPEQRLRLHLGRALANDPALVLLEHATASLSQSGAERFGRQLDRVAAGRRLALLAITEDQRFATAAASRLLRLRPATGAVLEAQGWRRWFR